ncbi:hypothetical protein GUJ93_ZPchr0008g12086 [Zizania palustris]|uniref:Uncharacterized protein n=1 Tax=Zizania palustris TaxID=103762 RepID=A0A8J5RLH9_ZIZPA|nr:hypothetical protein GUJ93_ZPchr0008g12086 [Zizania palustris]
MCPSYCRISAMCLAVFVIILLQSSWYDGLYVIKSNAWKWFVCDVYSCLFFGFNSSLNYELQPLLAYCCWFVAYCWFVCDVYSLLTAATLAGLLLAAGQPTEQGNC